MSALYPFPEMWSATNRDDSSSYEGEIYSLVIECSSLFETLTEQSGTDYKTGLSTGTSPKLNDSPSINPDRGQRPSESKDDVREKDKRKLKVKQMGRSFDLFINYTGALAAVGRSLDDRLNGHPDIKCMVVELLQMLIRNLQYISAAGLLYSKAQRDETSPQNLAEEAWSATESAIDGLHFMASAIRRSSTQSQRYNLSSRFDRDDDISFEEYSVLLVKRDFPNARRSLCEQLGASIAVRRKRLFRSNIHEEKLSTRREIVLPKQGSGPVAQPRVSPSQADAQLTASQPHRLKIEYKASPWSDDTRSKLDSMAVRSYLNRGPSLSTISTGSSVRNTKVDYPAKPNAGNDDKYCACPYCAKPLELGRLRMDAKYWENHIDIDVKPYVCLSEECTSPFLFFVHMKEWLDHMNTMHSEQWNQKIHMMTWYCDIEHGGEVLQFSDHSAFIAHMKDCTNHPKRQSPTDLQLDALSRSKQKMLVRQEKYSCPLCNCVPDSIEPVIQTGNPEEIKHLLNKHIAKHVKTLAFISVPAWTSTDPDQLEISDADEEDKRRLRSEGSTASYLTGFDSDIRSISLSFTEDPPRTDLEIVSDQLFEIQETQETHWDDIGFNDYKITHSTLDGEKDFLLEHFARLQHSNSIFNVVTPSQAKEKFHIGWICALPIEAAAAIQMLDENFGALQDQDRMDTNTYTLGRIGHHYVAIACLPVQHGIGSAVTVAKNMMRTFSKSLRIGLMVGIGGGIPSPDHDIRLGDIVVSHPEDGSCGGVIQHDMGKIGQDGKIWRMESLNTPPKSLLTALSQIRAAGLYQDAVYPSYIKQAIERNARTQKRFSRPDLRTDRLFRIEYEHPMTAPICDRCPVEWEEVRLPRKDSDPQIHYGIIASGNTVIKHGATREQIRQETGALCYEIEAAGLMSDFPCIVIRGVCDYADSHKNKEWQGYAALTAAAYTKEFLAYVPWGNLSQEILETDVCGNIERRCHQAFKTSNYEMYKNINPDRVEGTCEWVLRSPKYLRWWKATGDDLLWISADPGCGKSVLAKSLIDDIFKISTPKLSICYFFFKDNDEQNNLATALCAVLHQLFILQPQLLRHALPVWEKNQEKIQQEVEDLWKIFIAATSDPTSANTVCVFDALDECQIQDQKHLIEKLQKCYTQPSSSSRRNWLKFLVTSRPYEEIQQVFQLVTKSFPQIHLRGEAENNQIHNEISLVAKIRVAELSEMFNLKAETQARLEKELLQMEQRTYLWLHLVIDDIRNRFQDSFKPDQESISLIPKSVSEAYEKILDHVTPEQEATVRTILQIIIGAQRPLTIQEMAMALGVATSTQTRTAEEAGLNPEGLSERIRRLCGLFVFIKDSRIYLIHQTAREFLINNIPGSTRSKWYFKLSDAQIQVTQICVKYLLMDDLGGNKHEANVQSLLEYSAQNWPDHFREISSPTPELMAYTYQLYDLAAKRFALWFPIFWEMVMPHVPKPQMNALHLAAFNGHNKIIQRLIMDCENTINYQDSTRTTALQWASLRGHYKCVLILLESGADINTQGGYYGNALQAASAGGHLDIIKLLLDKGADINAQGGHYENALQAASAEGHIDIVQQLLEKGTKINTRGGHYGYALQAASAGGHLDIIKLLLDKGADIDAQGGYYGNALQAASAGGHLDTIKLLLDNGAYIDVQGGYYGNALQAASAGGHLDTIKLLLNNGAYIDVQGGYYGNALQAASAGGHLDTIKLLLGNGVYIDALGGYYGNALQAASAGGHLDTIKLLLDNGAYIDAQCGYYGNALQAASAGGHLDIIKLLLDKGAYINAQGGHYGNALQAASAGGYLDIVELLLDNGANINAQGGHYGSALQAASAGGYLDIVELLLGKGADINGEDGHYGNALQAASAGGYLDIVELLLDNGANINAQGGHYENALQAASAEGHIDIVQQLLEK
ncbi:hypothetical protein BGW36DRAFT_424603 [Talaromyces proteolyticus]|uniref:Nucleoside phosphorylase domain-containing protein n=1 Tax=Talaromyces proteolyticus TaxID=1131652 RepID=A0AAD4KXH5_9EURO|nr:uncharacterized protein BGW36DRAFT_424603 [Talaromyces proteolyticus]KAH8702324.1 hypothetical protein BGW36DRAFT_424603 [Talaromyces proteolyticus]